MKHVFIAGSVTGIVYYLRELDTIGTTCSSYKLIRGLGIKDNILVLNMPACPAGRLGTKPNIDRGALCCR